MNSEVRARRTAGQGSLLEMVIFVHGLWLTGFESLLLRRRLARKLGCEVHAFRYASVTGPMRSVVEQLNERVRALNPATLHLVGHSLGGLVIYRFLERFPEQPPGRVVFLGSPANGSRAARNAGRLRWAARLMGRCIAEELLAERRREWTFARPLGVIAGSRPAGLGRLLAHFDEPSDGTIAVSETRLAGANEHLVLNVSHMGMLLSARVARATGSFLSAGSFAAADAQPGLDSERSR